MMDNYLKFCFLLGIIYHQLDQFTCENQMNDGLRQDNCGVSLYQCKNGACIRESLICDRNRDCQEGEDEEGCIFAGKNSTFCAKADNRCSCDISSTLLQLNCTETELVSFPRFINRESMYRITLKGNKIPILTPGMFKDLGRLDDLVLERNEIVTIEKNAFIGLGYDRNLGRANSLHLDLRENNITQLTSRMFEPLGFLMHLSFKKNQISIIENEAFSNLTIEFLDLSGNKLTKLTPGMFSGVKKISKIDISQNEISTIENNAFYGLDDLQYLNISGNRITKLTPGMFEGLGSVRELYLQDNEIDTIENNTFNIFGVLYTLDLRRNKLSTVKIGMFNSPKGLINAIDLSYNGINTIENYTFNGTNAPAGLSVLDLSHNKLTEIKAHTFGNKATLKQLKLSNNEISRLESPALEKLTNLEYLDLSKNPIHDVDKGIFYDTPLDTLLVDDTRICCITYRKKCNYRTSETFFCEEHTNTGWYIGTAIFLIIIISIVVVVFKYNVCNAKGLCSRRPYTAPSNQGPDQL